jgi:hypothetical protein
MAEGYPGNYREVTDETDEFGRPWDPANHVDPVDAQWQASPETRPSYADYISPGGPSRDEVLDVRSGAVQAPGTRASEIGGPQSGK